MESLRAVALTREADRRLRLAARGRVHSAFARTVNLRLEGLGDAGWVSLHGPGPIPAPFGIACAALPRLDGLAGAPVWIEPDALWLGLSCRIGLGGAALRDSALPAAAPMPRLPDGPVAAAGGLLPMAVALLAGTTAPPDPLVRLAGPLLAALHAATAGRDAGRAGAAAAALLGLGPGLTPAGDDCLVGWLAGLRTGGTGLSREVGPALLAAAPARTTPLSAAFLAAAVAGEAAEPVRDFVVWPDAPRLAALLALGATSGADLLAGYLVARAGLSA
jgi:hypothetical protein